MLLLLCIAVLVCINCSPAAADNATDAGVEANGADRSLLLLKEGNLRFVKGNSVYPNQTSHQRKILALKGQSPFATIVCGSDSRVDPVLIFDRGLGDLFVIRSAGTVAGSDTLASVEYSMLALETPLMVVMGNTRSTLIRAAIDKVKMQGHMLQLLGKLEPAVKMTRILYPSLEGNELADKVAETNVRQVMRDVLSQCPAVLEKIRAGKAQMMGAVYDTDSGEVRWLGP
ncbi:carbonic anhydrase [Maridesulfovibrio sp. FT414]|uniref:carbonic anhydrase n=1 Tax=Maridesulfovibrio sp. FT414 TaxID=2979469 RepID=UPI003D804A1D